MRKHIYWYSAPCTAKVEHVTEFFSNGYGVSIVEEEHHLSDLYELAVVKGNINNYELCYDSGITEDVFRRITEKQVDEIMEQVKRLPAPYEKILEVTPIIIDNNKRMWEDFHKPLKTKMIYIDGNGNRSERTVEMKKMFSSQDGRTWVECYDFDKKDKRTFRLDRIQSIL